MSPVLDVDRPDSEDELEEEEDEVLGLLYFEVILRECNTESCAERRKVGFRARAESEKAGLPAKCARSVAVSSSFSVKG